MIYTAIVEQSNSLRESLIQHEESRWGYDSIFIMWITYSEIQHAKKGVSNHKNRKHTSNK